MITKLFLYFVLTIAMDASGAMASKPGQDDLEYEMGTVDNKKPRPKLSFPSSLGPSPALITASERHRQSKMYYNEGRALYYFMKRRPESIVIFGKFTNAESVSSCIKIGEIPNKEDDGEEEKKFIKEFNRIESQGSVVHLTPDNIEFYQKISYSVTGLTLAPGMSIGVMRKFEGQKDFKLLRRMKFEGELSMISY